VHARVFHELLGFNAADPPALVRAARARAVAAAGGSDVRVSLAPHAPYSVSPGLFGAIRADLESHPGDVSSVHLAESPEEVRFIADGTGPWRALLEDLGAWSEAWLPAGASPVAYLDRPGSSIGACSRSWRAEHRRPRTRRTRTIVACPRQAARRRRVPSLEAFAPAAYSGLRDGQSCERSDLNMFAELSGRGASRHGAAPPPGGRDAGRRRRPRIRRTGTIEAGSGAAHRRAPADAVGDVEEYLLSGVEPARSPDRFRNSQVPTPTPKEVKIATYLSFVRFSHSVFGAAVRRPARLAWRATIRRVAQVG
jgi:hypothetical protein